MQGVHVHTEELDFLNKERRWLPSLFILIEFKLPRQVPRRRLSHVACRADGHATSHTVPTAMSPPAMNGDTGDEVCPSGTWTFSDGTSYEGVWNEGVAEIGGVWTFADGTSRIHLTNSENV